MSDITPAQAETKTPALTIPSDEPEEAPKEVQVVSSVVLHNGAVLESFA